MSLDFTYKCVKCGQVSNASEMEFMVCECGGSYRLDTSFHDQSERTFEPHYDRTLRTWVTSERDKEKKMKKFKNYSHPDGLYNVRDDKKFMREMAHIQRHREDYKAATMPGYKPRTKSEIERQGEHKYDPSRPNRYRARTTYFT